MDNSTDNQKKQHTRSWRLRLAGSIAGLQWRNCRSHQRTFFSRYAPDGVVLHSITSFDTADYEEVPTGDMRVVAYLANDENLEDTLYKLEESLFFICAKSCLLTSLKKPGWKIRTGWQPGNSIITPCPSAKT